MRKRKYGVRSIILFLSISVSVLSACFCVLLMAGDYYTARNKLEIYNNEFQGWEACRQTEPGYFKSNKEAVNTCIKNLEEAKNNFWVKHPKSKIIPLFVLAGLGSAISGYLGVWAVWFGGLGICRFIVWAKLCIQNRSFRIRTDQKRKDTIQEVENLEYQMYKPVDDKDKAREEELIHQVEMLSEEVLSVGSNIDKLSQNEDFN